MQLRLPVEVKSAEVREKRGVAKRTGREYLMREQVAWADMGKEYPQEMVLLLGDNDAPYEPGKYFVDPKSLMINQYGSLAVGKVRLLKAAPASTKAA